MYISDLRALGYHCVEDTNLGDFGITLPAEFDMSYYNTLSDRFDKINYAKEKLPQETIVSYQNAIGKSMSNKFSKNTRSIAGFAGTRKYRTDLTFEIKRNNNPDDNIISIIREDGTHISSYRVKEKKLLQIIKDEFWILKGRDL